MKDQILKIAKVKSEKEFYKKYPTEEAFMKAHGKAFKKAAMGAKMVNDQLHQLTDFGNPPVAQVGTMIGGGSPVANVNKPIAFNDLMTGAKATNAGISIEDQMKRDASAATNPQATPQKGADAFGGIADIASGLMDKFGKTGKTGGGGIPSEIQDAIDSGFEMRHGGNVYRYQDGGMSQLGSMIGSAFGKKGGLGSGVADMFNIGGGSAKIKNVGDKGALGAGGAGFGAGAAAAGLGILDAAPQILQGVGQIKQQAANIKKADQFAQLSGVTAQAAESQPGITKNKYIRPEDSLLQPGQFNNPQGAGTNYLSAQNGTSIGGNETEVQNTYAPEDIYVGLGYEPLNDSNIKQYARGGNIPTAEFGDYFQDSGQASIGKGVGSAIGSAFFGPLGGKVGGFLGSVAGNLLGGADDANKLANLQDVGKKNTERAAWAQGANAIHAQNSAFMKDGGYTDDDHAWVSNSWQPQVITKFGEHSMKDLLKPPHDADMLRAGGHLSEYTPPSAEAMYTGKGKFAMGGDLQTHWGGKAETLSHNPYLPDGGETVMFRGQSHDETDGNGKSGIGVTYGDSPVEVERGEPAVKLKDGGSAGEDNLVVFGNMKIPDYGVKELGDKKAKGKKFKHYVADLSKQEAKQNKTIDKATEIVNSSNGNDPFDQLSLNAGRAMMMGAHAKLKDIADKKQKAAVVQNAILDTAEEFGVESDGLAKGKLRPIKDPSIGKDGKKLKKAQSGLTLLEQLKGLTDEDLVDPAHPERMEALKAYMSGNKTAPYQNAVTTPAYQKFEAPFLGRRPLRTKIPYDPRYVGDIIKADRPKIPSVSASVDQSKLAKHLADIKALKPAKIKKEEEGKGVDWEGVGDTLTSMYPFFRPTNQIPLDPGQLMGEMYALGNNQIEGVEAETYQPMLDQPYDISLQDQLNAIDAQARAAILAAGQDPSAQSIIMAQAADLKNKVLGEQFRMNQVNKAQVYQANRDALNKAQLQNLGILDNQYVREETGKSKTKAQTIEALSSISDKIAKNKLENRTAGIMENMYNYRYDAQGRAYNINNPYQFNIPQLGITDPNLTDNGLKDGTVPVYDNKGNIMAYKVVQPTKTKTKSNGGIVKAIKNL